VPRKLGQHFLADGHIAARTVRAARIEAGEAVVEIGPGRGALTHVLTDTGLGRLVLVEVDPELAASLRTGYAGDPRVSVVEADARSVDFSALPLPADAPYKAVGNLPYYAASPIIRALLESPRPPALIVAMVQREVAREMGAAPGALGLLSVAVQVYAGVELLFDVPPSAFRPPPKVTSTVVRLTPFPVPLFEGSAGSFFAVVKAGFRAPRKQMRNSLALGLTIELAQASEVLAQAGIEATRRPSTLSIGEWNSLHRAWLAAGLPTKAAAR
jgi:16S rRNA (adenine1518-N6/adenine1519-N6)-dimethyltransferase